MLGSRDRQRRNVLLYACHHGVDWKVVECLMKWNASKRGRILKWSDCDYNGHSSLLLVCLGGHTQLALRLLDEIEIEKYVKQNYPFHVLEVVIELSNEAHALAIAKHPKMQNAVKAEDKYARLKNIGGRQNVYSLQKCVKCAVKREMANVLGLLLKLNRPKVSKVTWLATFGFANEQKKKINNLVILGMANQFAKDRRWEGVKGVFLLRYRAQGIDIVQGQLRAHLVAGLPDNLFRLVVEFLKPSMGHRSEIEQVSMEVFADMLFLK